MIEQTRWIVRCKNGGYVEDWQYSQGHFSMRVTSDIFKALDIPRDHYADFFNDASQFEYIQVQFTATMDFEAVSSGPVPLYCSNGQKQQLDINPVTRFKLGAAFREATGGKA